VAPAAAAVRKSRERTDDFVPMWLTIVDFLERRKKRPYKPIVPRSLSTRAELATDDEEALPVIPYRRTAGPPGWMGTDHHDVNRQFSLLQTP
jgi:hypothetical protein